MYHEENYEITLHVSPLYEVPKILAFLGSILLMIYLSTFMPSTLYPIRTFGITLNLPLFVIITVATFLWIVHSLYDSKFVLSYNNVQSIRGLLSLEKTSTQISYANIAGVDIEKTVWQRLCGIGVLKIGSAGTDNLEVQMHGISSPRHYKDIIEERVRSARRPAHLDHKKKTRTTEAAATAVAKDLASSPT